MEALSCGPTLPSPKESGGRAGPLWGGQSGGRGLPRRPMSHNTGSAHTLSVSPCLPQPTLCSSHPPFSTGTAILVPPCVDQTQPPTACGLWPLICSTSLCGHPQLWPSVVRLGEEEPRPGSRCARAGLRRSLALWVGPGRIMGFCAVMLLSLWTVLALRAACLGGGRGGGQG